MPRPKGGYRTKDGTRVPGVTTITGRFKDAGGLIYWAWEQGRDGYDFRETRDSAADAGTLAHGLVEQRIRGEAHEPAKLEGWERASEEVRKLAQGAFVSFETWASMTKLKVVEQEVTLVSECYRYGGTPDAIIEVNGKLALGDWKSSNRLYRDNLIQLAAYRALWEEHHPDRPLDGGFHLVRFSKEHGDFQHHHFPALDEAWEMFLLLRRAYDIDKALKARAA